MTWWQTFLLSLVPAILVAILSNLNAVKLFKLESNKEKISQSMEKLSPILIIIGDPNPIVVLENLSKNKLNILSYGSNNACILLEKIMLISFENFENEIEEFRENGNSDLDAQKVFENFKKILPYFVLLFCQIKEDISSIVISPETYIKNFFNDFPIENKNQIADSVNSIVTELNLNEHFLIINNI